MLPAASCACTQTKAALAREQKACACTRANVVRARKQKARACKRAESVPWPGPIAPNWAKLGGPVSAAGGPAEEASEWGRAWRQVPNRICRGVGASAQAARRPKRGAGGLLASTRPARARARRLPHARSPSRPISLWVMRIRSIPARPGRHAETETGSKSMWRNRRRLRPRPDSAPRMWRAPPPRVGSTSARRRSRLPPVRYSRPPRPRRESSAIRRCRRPSCRDH